MLSDTKDDLIAELDCILMAALASDRCSGVTIECLLIESRVLTWLHRPLFVIGQHYDDAGPGPLWLVGAEKRT